MIVELAVAGDDGGDKGSPPAGRARRWRGEDKVVPTVDPVAGSDLRSLFDAHYAPMVRLATVMLGHNAAAEDVVQQAFVALDRRLPGLRPGTEAAYLRV